MLALWTGYSDSISSYKKTDIDATLDAVHDCIRAETRSDLLRYMTISTDSTKPRIRITICDNQMLYLDIVQISFCNLNYVIKYILRIAYNI